SFLVTIGLLGVSFSHWILPAIFFCGLMGFGMILLLSTSQSILQLSAKEHNRGQVMGIWAMILSGAVPLGNFIAGPAADLWSEPNVLFAEGAVCGGAVIILYLIFRPRKRF